MSLFNLHLKNFTPTWSRRCVVAGAFALLVTTSSVVDGASGATASHLRRITNVTLVGHGWGPGVGLGQWGAFGYAVRYHFGYERILNRYYGGTVARDLATTGQPENPTVSVLVNENMNQAQTTGYDPIVTASTTFSVTSQGGAPVISTTTTTTTTTLPATTTTTLPGSTTTLVPTTTLAPTTTVPPAPTSLSVPAGSAIDLRLNADGTWNAYEAPTCATAALAPTTTPPVATGLINPVVASVTPATTVSKLLVLCRHDGVDESVRGTIEGYNRSGYERTLNLLPLESYLDGVVPSESPASWGNDGSLLGAPQGEPWGFQALEAQAVAARGYVMAYIQNGGWNGYASICDTTSCQVYSGATYETVLTTLAVTKTAGEVRVVPTTPTKVADTRFYASSGGYTAPGAFPAVRDLGDVCVVPGSPTQCNPNHTWRITLTGVQIQGHYRSIGRLLTVHISARNGLGKNGGRALKIVLRGKRATKTVSANAFAAAMGLNSDWFAVGSVTRVRAASTAVPATIPSTTLPTTPTTTLPLPTTTSSLPVTTTTTSTQAH